MRLADFSGCWVFNPERSRLEIPPPESIAFSIDGEGDRFRLSRTYVTGGQEDRFTIELTVDGAPTQVHHKGIEIQARAFRDGDALAFDSTLRRGGEEAVNRVRYRLTDGGATLVAEERFDGFGIGYVNHWVLEKRP